MMTFWSKHKASQTSMSFSRPKALEDWEGCS